MTARQVARIPSTRSYWPRAEQCDVSVAPTLSIKRRVRRIGVGCSNIVRLRAAIRPVLEKVIEFAHRLRRWRADGSCRSSHALLGIGRSDRLTVQRELQATRVAHQSQRDHCWRAAGLISRNIGRVAAWCRDIVSRGTAIGPTQKAVVALSL